MRDLLSYLLPELNFWGDEFEIDHDLANYKEIIFARGGKICLTNKRLIFIPNILEKFFNAKEYIFDLNKVENVEIATVDFKDFFGGGTRRRLKLFYCGEEHYFVINKLEYWNNLVCSVIKKEKMLH